MNFDSPTPLIVLWDKTGFTCMIYILILQKIYKLYLNFIFFNK